MMDDEEETKRNNNNNNNNKRNNKWHSCRLRVHNESGRVRWCIGHETAWRTKVKRLTILPILLLILILVSICVTHYYKQYRLELERRETIEQLHIINRFGGGDSELDERDRRFEEERTNYILDRRTKRYATVVNDSSSSSDLLEGDESRVIVWKVALDDRKRNIDDRPTVEKKKRDEFLDVNDDRPTVIKEKKRDDVFDMNDDRPTVEKKTRDDNEDDNRPTVRDELLDIENADDRPTVEKKTRDDMDEDNRPTVRDELLDIENADDRPSVEEIEHENFWKLKHTADEIRRTQAKNMLKFMDVTMDPCDDFYQFACGNWHRYNPIPADRSSFDTFEMLRESLDSVLRDLLEEDVPLDKITIDRSYWTNLQPIMVVEQQREKRHVYDFYKIAEHKDVPAPFYQVILNHSFPQTENAIVKAKYLYKSCMNEDLIKIRGIKPLLYLIDELGGWPILDAQWSDKNYDFEWLLGNLRLYNNDIIISEWVGPDIRNSEEYIIQIDQSTLGLPSRDYFLEKSNRKFVDAYKHFIETVAVLLGADPTTASSDTDDIVNFEISLSAITVSAEHRKNVSDIYVRLTLKELHSIIPQIDWFKYVGIVIAREPSPNDSIVTFGLNYLHRLVGLLSVTSPRVQTNYLLWRFIRHRVNNLDDRFQDAKQRFYKVLFGREQSPARWQSCISQVNSNLGMALGNMFVKKYFDERSKNDTLQMTQQLRQSFKELLMETEWLDVDTKAAAALKIDYMRLKIGYPNYILNDNQLDVRYRDVQIHPDFYFENTLSILQHLTRLEHSKLRVPVDKNFWNSPPAVVNAYYSRNKNQIMFPAGILQPPFYHRHFPRSLNYGGIGVVIGHEMTHGFDDKGRLFDKDGNLKVWWKRESIEEFHQRSKCLIEQYNAYIVPEANMQMDGANTQGENIADNGGIKQAFRAYNHWLLHHPNANETLDGLNLTNLQLFFLNFAQIWCGTTRPEAARNKLRTAVHSPGRFRVIGTLSNSDEFAEVYQCAVGAPMNPKRKCKIW